MQLEVKAGSDLEEVELRVVELLDQVITDCRCALLNNTLQAFMFGVLALQNF